MLYLTIFGAFLFLRLASTRDMRARLTTYSIVLFLLFLFTAFRFEVGCDWTGYFAQYELQRGAGLESAWQRREPLWWVMIELTHMAGLPYPWLNVFSSLLFFAGVHVFARRQPDPLSFLILLFPILIINMPMSGIRQGAAIGLMCIALTAFLDRRLIHFLFWTFVAAGFHSSALIFLLLTPMVWGSYTKIRLMAAAALAIPGIFLLATGDGGEIALARYVDSGTDAFGAAYRAGMLFLSGIFFHILLRRQWQSAFPWDFKLASLGALMMLAVFPLVAFSTVIADRLGYFFIPLQAMIFARVPFLRGGSNGRLLTVLPYLGMALVLIIWTSTSWHFNKCYVPYQTWLFGFPTNALYF